MSDGFFSGGRRAAVCLSFDDARPSQITNGLDVLAEHSLPATFYVLPDKIQENLDGWRRAVAAGHEIGNHTMYHPCTGNFCWSREHALEEYTLEQMEKELVEANRSIQQQLGVWPRTFGYPCCQSFVGRGEGQKSYVPLVARLFLAGRASGGPPNDPVFCDLAHFYLSGSDGRTFESLRSVVDEAVEAGAWIVFAGHDIAESGSQTTSISALRELGAYLRQRQADIWVDTVAAVAEHIRQSRQTKPL